MPTIRAGAYLSALYKICQDLSSLNRHFFLHQEGLLHLPMHLKASRPCQEGGRTCLGTDGHHVIGSCVKSALVYGPRVAAFCSPVEHTVASELFPLPLEPVTEPHTNWPPMPALSHQSVFRVLLGWRVGRGSCL